MVNLSIPLKANLHSSQGKQPKVSFDLRKNYYTINGEKTSINLCRYGDVLYWSASVLNKFVLVTLHYKEDIL